MIFYLLCVPSMCGWWRPRNARTDEEEHEMMVREGLAKLQATRPEH